MDENFFQKQIKFLIEIDKLKSIERKASIIHGNRKENDAEHSWHLTMMALVLQDYANGEVDILKVIKMLMLHDLVEIDAGDTFAYDLQGQAGKYERELSAANRIFGLLPEEQRKELMDLWVEFEQKETIEAKYASALDRLQPLIHNHLNEGDTWRKYGITSGQVLERNAEIANGSEKLWDFAKEMIEKSVAQGILSR